MKIAIEGCAHGELDKIYDAIEHLEKKENIKVDLLICCGDFQSTRNVEDLRCMAVPLKYQSMCSFYKYYSGEKTAPILTLFIGGNHEASNYLQELAYGGWAAPNIYYMGYASIVNIGGVRIAGLSGIYKGHDYMKGHFEKPPYSEDTKRSVYHIRNLETFRLKQIQQPIDFFLSHDWPRGVYNFGDVQKLLKLKPFFQNDVNSNSLGSKPCEELLHCLKPTYWFSAHLHVKFAAVIPHSTDLEVESKQTTKFLALDKCLPKRKFLQVVDIPHDTNKSLNLEYDLEWLTILHLTNHLLSVKKGICYMPGPGSNERWIFTPTAEELNLVRCKFDNNLRIPDNFSQTVTPYDPNISNSLTSSSPSSRGHSQPSAQINPQTMAFCEQLSVDDPMALLLQCDSSSTSLNSSQLSSCTLPSFLTPEKPGEITQVSFSMLDSSYDLENDDTVELEFSSEHFTNPIVTKAINISSPVPMGRLSLALPSPQNSDVDEPLLKCSNEDAVNSPKRLVSGRLSLALPSPRDSDGEELTNSGNEDLPSSISLELSSLDQSFTGTVNESEVLNTPETVDSQPKVKKFKRRNQAFYSSTDEDC